MRDGQTQSRDTRGTPPWSRAEGRYVFSMALPACARPCYGADDMDEYIAAVLPALRILD